MASATSNHHHQINYVEITVHDMATAKHFYSAAFGFTLQIQTAMNLPLGLKLK